MVAPKPATDSHELFCDDRKLRLAVFCVYRNLYYNRNPWMERPMKIPLVPTTPQAVTDARMVICDPELAARLPETLRRVAFMIVASQHGIRVSQRQRPARKGPHQ